MGSMQPEEIKHLIEAELPKEAFVEGDGTHFTAIVISPVLLANLVFKNNKWYMIL